MSMTVRELLTLGERQLIESGIRDAVRDSKSLYCYLIGIPETKLFMEYQYTIQDLLCEQYFDLVDRRASGEPLQYIVGTQEFMGLTFNVDPRVLIPRMDTEVLVDNALSLIQEGKLVGEGARVIGDKTAWSVLDLCAGSGAIGISIAKLAGKAEVTLSDISEGAIDVAKDNAKKNGVSDKVRIVQGDLFAPFKKLFRKQKFDMIVSNPPYIEKAVIPTLQKEIFEHEPMAALDGGEDGLDFYRRIAIEAPDYLEDGGVLLLEIGDAQGEAVKTLLQGSVSAAGTSGGVGEGSHITADKKSKGRFKDVRIIKDLAGRDRVVFGLYAKEK